MRFHPQGKGTIKFRRLYNSTPKNWGKGRVDGDPGGTPDRSSRVFVKRIGDFLPTMIACTHQVSVAQATPETSTSSTRVRCLSCASFTFVKPACCMIGGTSGGDEKDRKGDV